MYLRSSLAFALAIALILGAVSNGAGRGQADAAGILVICTGHGTVKIYVDAEGEPVPAPHICPDCALCIAALPKSPETAMRAMGVSRHVALLARTDRPRPIHTAGQARAPPSGALIQNS
ncbi:MAG: hypothetical protein AAGK37_15770 [Pseudomonadota bacterium]